MYLPVVFGVTVEEPSDREDKTLLRRSIPTRDTQWQNRDCLELGLHPHVTLLRAWLFAANLTGGNPWRDPIAHICRETELIIFSTIGNCRLIRLDRYAKCGSF
jgi:hypothetical protein